MAAIAGTIKAIQLIGEPFDGSTGRYNAQVFVTYPAYTASSDTTTVAGVGAAIAAVRRDGKTVTLAADSGVCQSQSGLQGTTQFYNDTLTVSTDAVNGELSNVSGTEIDAPSGVTDRPCAFIVAYTLT
jgi:hypothetical protein